MSEIANPHDSFFKALLAQPGVAADFLAHYLPPDVAVELDVTTPEISKDSFVDAELQPHLSDLLYRVSLKEGGPAYVYLLFEHKSAPDGWVALQLSVTRRASGNKRGANRSPSYPRSFRSCCITGAGRGRMSGASVR